MNPGGRRAQDSTDGSSASRYGGASGQITAVSCHSGELPT